MSLQASYKRPFKPRFGTPQERFMRLVERTDGCWLWKGTKDYHGYGWFWVERGRQIRAHRASYEFFRGPIENGLHVCHTCDNNHRDRSMKIWAKRGLPGNPRGYKKQGRYPRRHGGTFQGRRMVVCKRGHPFTQENVMKNGVGRTCRPCYQLRLAKRRPVDNHTEGQSNG